MWYVGAMDSEKQGSSYGDYSMSLQQVSFSVWDTAYDFLQLIHLTK
jgi:hypothetical protein